MVRATIKKTLELLPPTTFFQIHRSYIIALPKVDKIEDNHVFIGKTKIPIGTTYRDEFLEFV